MKILFIGSVLLITLSIILSLYQGVKGIKNLDMLNFDVREKFNSCFNDPLAEDYNDISDCYTNWPIQFSLIMTDKLCILKGKGKRILSPMNLISCIRLGNDTTLDCRNSQPFYNDTATALETINTSIK
jgi:hypothetical protein